MDKRKPRPSSRLTVFPLIVYDILCKSTHLPCIALMTSSHSSFLLRSALDERRLGGRDRDLFRLENDRDLILFITGDRDRPCLLEPDLRLAHDLVDGERLLCAMGDLKNVRDRLLRALGCIRFWLSSSLCLSDRRACVSEIESGPRKRGTPRSKLGDRCRRSSLKGMLSDFSGPCAHGLASQLTSSWHIQQLSCFEFMLDLDDHIG